MMPETDSFFTTHRILYQAPSQKKQAALPFKTHAQFPLLINILSRKDHHHALLYTKHFSTQWHTSFLNAFAQYLMQDTLPPPLRQAELIELHLEEYRSIAKQKSFERELLSVRQALDTTDSYRLIVFTHSDLFFTAYHTPEHLLYPLIQLFTHHAKCRLLLFTTTSYPLPTPDFDVLTLVPPSAADSLILLKQYRAELESFHRVVIPDEVLTQAHVLAKRYLSTPHALEKALLLLDSSAAHASGHRHGKPIVSATTLTTVLSTWTRIPATHLSLHPFKLQPFMSGMQQQLFGQEAAISIMAQALQQAHTPLYEQPGPFWRFLFVGPVHSGKKTAAQALAQQLFKQSQTLFFVLPDISKGIESILDLRVTSNDANHLCLKNVIQQMPFAIIVFAQIEQATPPILRGLQEILTTGQYTDDHGQSYDFHQAIVILTTHYHAKYLSQFAQATANTPFDFILGLQDAPHTTTPAHHDSPQEMAEAIRSEISHFLPLQLCPSLTVIPFLPLDQYAIENIIRVHLRTLGKNIQEQYGIELSYASEVLRYLVQASRSSQDDQPIHVKKGLASLYGCIEHTLLEQRDKKNLSSSNQLFLQLNETGQSLHCSWLTLTSRQHAT